MCGTAAWETEAGGDKQPVRDGLSMVPKELLRIFNVQFKFVSGATMLDPLLWPQLSVKQMDKT